jgi:hypothetical protein
MYRRRLANVFVFLLLLGLVVMGCTPGAGNETAVDPAESRAPLVAAPEGLSPQQVTANFYNWYLDLAGNRADSSFVNPLVSGAYRDSEYLSATFMAQVDEMTMASRDGLGFDPFLLAQDIPVSFEVQEATVNEATAVVDIHFYWGGNPDPSVRTVHLKLENGRWLIDGLTMEMVETVTPPAPQMPERVAAAFYTWYLDYIGDRASDNFRNPLVDQAYHDAPYLTASFIGHVDELLAEMRAQDMGGYDPFLCAQDIPTEMTPDVVFARNGVASVVMRSSFPNHLVTVDLRPEGDSWVISNITCAGNPAGIATAFYTWYLGYIGDRASGDFRNPLVDKAYQGHPLLAESFTQEVGSLLASFDRGGYDPFLLAQDIPTDFSVDPGVVEETAVVHLQFGPSSAKHLLVTVDARRQIVAIGENELLPSSGPGEEMGQADLQNVYVSEAYSFSLRYPAGWVLQEEKMGGPGPDDWPVTAVMVLMPQDVADILNSRSGPPDPTAPIIVAPFQIEIVEGDAKDMERVYYNFSAGMPAKLNDLDVIILELEPGYTHIIYPHPYRPSTWIVITDWVTEFPGREIQGMTAAPVKQPLLSSLQFHN